MQIPIEIIAPMKNRFSLETDTFNAGGRCAFPKVVIVYDDVPAGQHALRVLAKMFPEPYDRLQLVPRLWRFDFLVDADWFYSALAEAADADIIVIATSSTHGLNFEVEKWINTCLPRKRGSQAAVIALLGPEGDTDGQDSSRLRFLQNAVQKAGLDFFAPQSRRERLTENFNIHEAIGLAECFHLPETSRLADAENFR
jgi:hypothetical protein